MSEQISKCEGCSKAILDGDKYHSGSDVDLCEECAPSYEDLISKPDYFRGVFDDNPLTAQVAQKMFDDHISAGGKPEDKMVSP